MEEKKKKIDGRKAAFERRRRKGYEAYLKRKHKEMAEREREEKKQKEKERKKKEKERLKRLKEKKKRPVGRPKKRGPKKKRKKKKKSWPYDGYTDFYWHAVTVCQICITGKKYSLCHRADCVAEPFLPLRPSADLCHPCPGKGRRHGLPVSR